MVKYIMFMDVLRQEDINKFYDVSKVGISKGQPTYYNLPNSG